MKIIQYSIIKIHIIHYDTKPLSVNLMQKEKPVFHRRQKESLNIRNYYLNAKILVIERCFFAKNDGLAFHASFACGIDNEANHTPHAHQSRPSIADKGEPYTLGRNKSGRHH